jgi:transcriptional regulator with XRE-family HTH domain
MTTETQATAAEAWIPSGQDFGSRLALVRHKMGWNVKEAARECGLPAATWHDWEAGSSPRNLVTISMAIATRTNADFLWLVHGPDRGGAKPTHEYDPLAARVVTTIGQPIRRHRAEIHRPPATRPVQQTRPLVRASRRPATPVTV